MGDDLLNTMWIIRDEAGEKRWADLKARVVEHNIRSVRTPNHGTTLVFLGWSMLKLMTISMHRMMAQYYTKIRLGRMATLLALTEAETEDCLSDMVGKPRSVMRNEDIKIQSKSNLRWSLEQCLRKLTGLRALLTSQNNRLDWQSIDCWIVCSPASSSVWNTILCQDPLENLNTWSYNTNKLMDLVMKTTHLINKEEMVSSWWRIGRNKNSTPSRFTKLWEQELWQRQSDLSLLVLVVI